MHPAAAKRELFDHPDGKWVDGILDRPVFQLPNGQQIAETTDEEREYLAQLKVPDPPADSMPPPSDDWDKVYPPSGVPGKTYPYPKEDEESEGEFKDFRRVRDLMMKNALHLATNFNPDAPDINLRSLALSRMLDGIHHLDQILPNLNPEQLVRFEYVYDGMVHDKPLGKILKTDDYPSFELLIS